MHAPTSLLSIVVAVPDQVCCRLKEETLVLELKNGAYYGLNLVGSAVWDMIQQPQSIESVYSSLLNRYDVDAEICKHDLLAFGVRQCEFRVPYGVVDMEDTRHTGVAGETDASLLC
jgi:hypothetical protein